jgi:hypothetical protein
VPEADRIPILTQSCAKQYATRPASYDITFYHKEKETALYVNITGCGAADFNFGEDYGPQGETLINPLEELVGDYLTVLDCLQGTLQALFDWGGDDRCFFGGMIPRKWVLQTSYEDEALKRNMDEDEYEEWQAKLHGPAYEMEAYPVPEDYRFLDLLIAKYGQRDEEHAVFYRMRD